MVFDPSRVTYSLEVEVDGTPLEGNVSACGDDGEDLSAEYEVAQRLRAGDVWAWACVTVEARYPGLPFVGRSILGTCSYASESEFIREGGYYTDMKAEALSDLQEQAERVVAALAE